MKVQDFKKVEKLMAIASKLREAHSEIDFSKVSKKDPGGVGEFEEGYAAFVSLYGDGSGSPIDLGGCYLGLKLYQNVKLMIEEQFKQVVIALESFGVDCSNMSIEKE